MHTYTIIYTSAADETLLWNGDMLVKFTSTLPSSLIYKSAPSPLPPLLYSHFLCYTGPWEPTYHQYSRLWLVCSSSYYFLWHWKSCPVSAIIPGTSFPCVWSHKAIKPAIGSARAAVTPPTLKSKPLDMEPASESWFPPIPLHKKYMLHKS